MCFYFPFYHFHVQVFIHSTNIGSIAYHAVELKDSIEHMDGVFEATVHWSGQVDIVTEQYTFTISSNSNFQVCVYSQTHTHRHTHVYGCTGKTNICKILTDVYQQVSNVLHECPQS
jgi:hypothetical protein